MTSDSREVPALKMRVVISRPSADAVLGAEMFVCAYGGSASKVAFRDTL